jgi:hypothetical protein
MGTRSLGWRLRRRRGGLCCPTPPPFRPDISPAVPQRMTLLAGRGGRGGGGWPAGPPQGGGACGGGCRGQRRRRRGARDWRRTLSSVPPACYGDSVPRMAARMMTGAGCALHPPSVPPWHFPCRPSAVDAPRRRGRGKAALRVHRGRAAPAGGAVGASGAAATERAAGGAPSPPSHPPVMGTRSLGLLLG